MSVSPNTSFSEAEKRATRAATHAAVRRGEIQRPNQCSRCGSVGPLDVHHFDYSDPLDIAWLCNPCHLAGHAATRALTRATKAAKAQRLRDLHGLKGTDIAKRMGISISYAYELLDDPTGAEARERKRRLASGRVCEKCGASINISSKRWCLACMRGGAGRLWTRESIVAAIRAFHAEVGRPPRVTDLNPALAEKQGLSDAAERRERFERMHLPTPDPITRAFGSLDAAVVAAGYRPFHPIRDRDWGPHRPRRASAA